MKDPKFVVVTKAERKYELGSDAPEPDIIVYMYRRGKLGLFEPYIANYFSESKIKTPKNIFPARGSRIISYVPDERDVPLIMYDRERGERKDYFITLLREGEFSDIGPLWGKGSEWPSVMEGIRKKRRDSGMDDHVVESLVKNQWKHLKEFYSMRVKDVLESKDIKEIVLEIAERKIRIKPSAPGAWPRRPRTS